jgi:hypothetical protein
VVLLSGEPGIGKSRLTAALIERLANEPHTRSRYFCSPQRTDSALYPIISQMERAAGLAHDDSAQTKLDKLDALLAQTSASTQDAALFAEMLSLPNDGRYPALDLDPQQRRQKTLEALTAQVEALSRHNSLLMIFEDAHWTDPTSLETLPGWRREPPGSYFRKRGPTPGAAGGVKRTRLVEAQRRAGSRRQPPQQQVLQRFADAKGTELVEVESAKHDARKRPCSRRHSAGRVSRPRPLLPCFAVLTRM